MQIYVHSNNQQLGPFTEAEVKAQLASGALSLQDHVWWQGQANWLPLSQTPLATPLSPGIPPLPGSIAPMPGVVLGYPYATEKTSNLALWSLISGISAFFCGITFIPAIILGHMGLSETKKNPAIQGRGMALAGTIIGYVVFAFYVFIPIIAIGVLMVLGNQVKSTFKTINAQVQAAQSSSSQDDTDQSTNSANQSTNNAPDSSTNSAPTITP